MRKIPWNASSASTLSSSAREVIARAWRYRMWNEAGAAGAFSRLADECEASGARPVVIKLGRAAASDEVRHAELCRKLAALYSGRAEPGPAAFPELPAFTGDSPAAATLYRVVLVSCISETIGCAFQREIADSAEDPTVCAAQEVFFADEIGHGRLGWAYLAMEARRAPERLLALEVKLPALIEAYARGLPAAEDRRPALPEGAAHGLLGRARAQRVFREVLAQVILPGFASFGIATGPIRARYLGSGAAT